MTSLGHNELIHLSLHVQYGDYEEETFQASSLAMDELLPQRVIDQYQMTSEMWAQRIEKWYADHRGMAR